MILIGNDGKLEINILRRSNLEADDYWDGNWLDSEIRIDVQSFKSLYGTNLRVDDLQMFCERLIALRGNKENEAEFTTLEDGLYLHCKLEYNGIINCRGKANNDTGNSLEFRLQTDLVSLDIFIHELEVVLKSYPLVDSFE